MSWANGSTSLPEVLRQIEDHSEGTNQQVHAGAELARRVRSADRIISFLEAGRPSFEVSMLIGMLREAIGR